ncbi:MAG: hypothetical protein JWL77_61 [Chthonomonadaceae bacterium]|nr:hypothetical protein [Chthonomonadaceae bacterium]
MQTPRIGAVMVVQNDAETVERSLASFYDKVEVLVVSTDPKRGWSGVPITPDDTLDRIRAFDKDKKIEIIEGDFFHYPQPMRNDTYQRQVTVDHLMERRPDLDWVVQVDADEVFLDYDDFIACVAAQPATVRGIVWRLIIVFNYAEDGRNLVIVGQDGEPLLEPFSIAHRPQYRLHTCRLAEMPEINGKPDPAAQYVLPANVPYGRALLHYSYAKSEERIWEKLQTWSHSDEVDAEAYFALWKRTRKEWATIRDFHPTFPTAWHALKPYTDAELRALNTQIPSTPSFLQRATRKLGRMLKSGG